MRVDGDALERAIALSRREKRLLALRRSDDGTSSGMPDEEAALRDATRALGEAGIPFALIGGLAVGVRSGVPRATLDIDLAIPSNADLELVSEALVAHGFVRTGAFAHRIDFRHASGEPVQIAFDPRFDPMIRRAEPVAFGDLTIPVVTTGDLIESKRMAAAGPARRRSKAFRDLADIALLEGDVGDPDEGW